MKITENSKFKFFKLNSLQAGALFKLGDEVYMLANSGDVTGLEPDWRCVVCMSTGRIESFYEHLYVEPLAAELILNSL